MIRLEDACRTFALGDQQVRALQHIDLSLQEGEYAAVMGPSGSGKSTLLNLLGLLDRPDSGRYWLDGVEAAGLEEEARSRLRAEKIGFVFQAFHLIPRLNAWENVELPLVLAGMEPAQRRPLVDAVLARLGLSDRAGHLPNQLSGGQRQRVAIGRAIVTRPRLLLADEPTGNLDSHSGEEVIELLEELNREGITLVVVTHDPRLGARARRTISMIDGRIVEDRGAG